MTTVKHRVLYVNGHPVRSEPFENPGTDEVFAAIRAREINKALASGAEPPVFRDTIRTATETGGPDRHKVEEVDYSRSANQPQAKSPNPFSGK